MKARLEVATFVARWDGHCFVCERGIHRGTVCVLDDEGRPAHFECPAERPVVVCQICWQQPCEHSEDRGGAGGC